MKGYVGKAIWVLVATCGLAATGSAAEEEAPVYELLADVKIGRVFLSPAQRHSLDDRRGKAPAVATASAPAARSVAKQSPDAAGYIKRSGGPSRVWSNGNFVPADDVSGVTFPGDIEVLRKATLKPEIDPGAADDSS